MCVSTFLILLEGHSLFYIYISLTILSRLSTALAPTLTLLGQDYFWGTDWRNVKGQLLASDTNSRPPGRKPFTDSTSLSDSKSTEASTSISVDDLSAVDSAAMPSTSRAAEVRLTC